VCIATICRVYDKQTRVAALDLIESGLSLNAVSKSTGINRATLRSWRDEPARVRRSTCVRCQPEPGTPVPAATYSYVLGLYLGDGCISAYAKGVFGLRIACADAWPGLLQECVDAIALPRPSHGVSRFPCAGHDGDGLLEALAMPVSAARARNEAHSADRARVMATADRRRAHRAVSARAVPLGRVPDHKLDSAAGGR